MEYTKYLKKSYEILEKSYEILEEKVTRYLNELELPAGNARMDGDSVNSLTKNCEPLKE